MCMGQQQRKVERLVFEFRQQRAPKGSQSRPGVENDDVIAGPDFHAGRVASKMHRLRSRRRDRAAHAPEFYISGVVDGTILIQPLGKTNCKTLPVPEIP